MFHRFYRHLKKFLEALLFLALLVVYLNQIEPKEENVIVDLEKMVWFLESPQESCGASAWNTFKLVASTDVKVTLDGQGADEQLGGYLPYLLNYISSLSIVDMFSQAKKCLQIPNSSKYVFVGLCLGIYRVLFGEKFLKFTIKNIFKKDFEINLNQKLADDINKNLITLIHYSDHISMAHSIESRMPFMDYRVVEFLASVPSCYKMRNGWTKYLARIAFNGKLPDEITWRKDKLGWPIPQDYWFRGASKNHFIKEVNSSKLVKRYSIDIERELNGKTNINKLVRYLVLSKFEKNFKFNNFN